MNNRVNILDLKHNKAKDFFLENESYCNIDLPNYFDFSDLLNELYSKLKGRNLSDIKKKGVMENLDDVNHVIYANKDGKLSWRPLQIIHPLVYIALVCEVTKKENWEKTQNRFNNFKNDKIKCLSIPVKSKNKKSNKSHQILHWWEEVEQQSIFLALEYKYLFDTDIADCYASIYTHAIAWAIEGKNNAKKHKNDNNLLGNFIDKNIQNAQYQQTNGIPQGSVLMDFISEMILGYIDKILYKRLKSENIEHYKILRYRDDYRIFVKSINDGEKILKCLSEIMMPFGFKLNNVKTKHSNDVITQSIKSDKLAWLNTVQNNRVGLQKAVLVIRQHSIKYPNSGSLSVALSKYDRKLQRFIKSNKKIKIKGSLQIISIISDIAYNNPRAIPVCCSIISKLLIKLDNSNEVSKIIYEKLIKMPNSGILQIWLQRMLKNDLSAYSFTEKVCLLKNGGNSLWNNSWISDKKVVKIIEKTPIFQQDKFDGLDNVISNDEIDIFSY